MPDTLPRRQDSGIPVSPPVVSSTPSSNGAAPARSLTGLLPAVPASGALPVNLSRFRRALQRAEAGTASCRVLCVGDSTTLGVGAANLTGGAQSYPGVLRSKLGSYLIRSSYTLGVPQQGGNNDGRWASTGGWSYSDGNPLLGFGGLAAYKNSRASGTLTYAPGNPVDTITVYFLGSNGNAVVPVTIDGTAAADLNTGVGNGWGKQTYTVGLGTHTIVFGTPGGAGTGAAFITAVEAFDSTAREVQIGNAGVGSSTSGGWTDGSFGGIFNSVAGITAYAPDLTVILLGTNDSRNGFTTAAHTANLQTLITAAKASGDVLLVAALPAATDQPGAALLTAYRDADAALAAANGAAFVDLYARYGSNAAASSAGFAADTIGHLTTAGYADMADAIFQTLLVVT